MNNSLRDALTTAIRHFITALLPAGAQAHFGEPEITAIAAAVSITIVGLWSWGSKQKVRKAPAETPSAR